MAEVLSMRDEPKVELTPDEQESLAIGEEMAAKQENLLAGKYKNAQELEKAYKELESKIGVQNPPDQESVEAVDSKEPEVKEDKTTVETAFLESLWDESQKEGDFKQETLDKLKGLDPTKLAQEYLNYRAGNQPPEPRALSKEDVKTLHNVTGGAKGYNDMVKWAVSNIDKSERDMFDAVIDSGDSQAAYFAVQAMNYKYNDAQGVDAPLLTGKAATPKAPGFKSQAALVAAMNDPKYDNDPAYRQEVMEKLARSDIDF